MKRPKKRPNPPAQEYRCRARTKSGKQCRRPKVRGDDYCAMHNGMQPAMARAGGKARGEKYRKAREFVAMIAEIAKLTHIDRDPEKHREWCAGLAVLFLSMDQAKQAATYDQILAAYHRQAGESVGDIVYQAEYYEIEPKPKTVSEDDAGAN